jgi:hypothetical protein
VGLDPAIGRDYRSGWPPRGSARAPDRREPRVIESTTLRRLLVFAGGVGDTASTERDETAAGGVGERP